MAKVWAKNGERKPVSARLLSLHHGHGVPRSQTGAKVCRGQNDFDHDLRGDPQPPAATGGHGDGVDHLGRREHAPVGLDAELRRGDDEP